MHLALEDQCCALSVAGMLKPSSRLVVYEEIAQDGGCVEVADPSKQLGMGDPGNSEVLTGLVQSKDIVYVLDVHSRNSVQG